MRTQLETLSIIRNGEDIVVSLTGTRHAPEPAVGLPSADWDITATRVDNEDEVIELTDAEEDRAWHILEDSQNL